MWTYDGESWIDEGASPDQTNGHANGEVKRPTQTSHFDELYPELQVVEITPVVPRTNRVPPLPFP